MPKITTKNSLTDFDICLALAQKAINTQMKSSWNVWTKKRGFKNKIEIFKTKRAGQIVDSPYGMTVVMAAPTVDLNVPDAKLAQVKVTLTLESGTVVYLDEESEGKAELDFKNWSISFLCNLDKRPVDLKALQAIDPEAEKTAKEFVERTGLPESVFSIEYLFLRFTTVDLMLSGNNDIRIPETIPFSARTKALSVLSLLLQGQIGDYMLGTVVRRNNKEATPTFALTDFIFDVRPNWSVGNTATLNYLGMFSRQPMPKDTTAARLKLSDAWVRPEQFDGKEATVSGVMAISGRIFLEKYLIPRFRAALTGVQWESVLGTAGIGRPSGYEGPAPSHNGLEWTFTEEIKTGTELPDAVGKLKLRLEQSYRMTVTAHPSTTPRQVSIAGRIDCRVYVDGMLPIFDNVRTQWIHVEGHQDFSGGLDLTGNGIGTDFNLESKLSYKFHDAVLDKRESGGANILNVVSGIAKAVGLMADNAEEMFVKAQKGTSEKLLSTVKAALDRLHMDLKQHCFIPPGGGVFTFQNPSFSNAGDLFLDVIYIRS